MPSKLSWIVRKILGTVGGRTLAVLVALLLLYQGWLTVTAMAKVADGVGLEQDARGRFGVEVVLGFEPERFHVLQLQDYGRVRRTEGNVIDLRSVTEDDVARMARLYWIEEIRPGPESGPG